MRGLVPLAAAALALWPEWGGSADWRTRLTFSQNGTVRSDSSDSDVSLRSRTRLGFNTTVETPTTTWSLSPSLSLRARSDAAGDADALSPGLALRSSVAHTQPRFGVNASLSVTPQFVSDREFTSLEVLDPVTGLVDVREEVTDVDPLEITIVGDVGFSARLDDRSSVTASAFVRARELDQTTNDLQPSRTFGGGVEATRALTPRTSLLGDVSVVQFSSENESVSDTLTARGSLGVSRSFTSRHNGSGTVGLSASDNGDSVVVGFTGGGNFRYTSRDASIGVSINQRVAQNGNGEILSVLSLRADTQYSINTRSRIGIRGRLSSANPLFGDNEDEEVTLTIEPTYQLQLTEAWRLSASYGLSVGFEDETSFENRATISISRDFELFR